ncbi:MAG TPA: M28 family peptidase [Candidatus Deferrimicrobium sp.]|nr:M28 family peptidase [Candidatus Deferrimicrobium sp.]
MKTEESDADYIYNIVDTICKKFGSRYSCSEGEREASLWIKDELDKFCDETSIDEFGTHPHLYPQGIFKILGILGGISFIFMPLKFPGPIFSAFLIFLGLFILLTELFFMKEWISVFFKKRTSRNVFGIIKPMKDPKFRIIFEGHTDSPKQMTIASYEGNPPIYKFVLGICFLVITITFSLIKFIRQLSPGSLSVWGEWGIFSWTSLDLIYFILFGFLYPFFIYTIRGFLGDTDTLGANDNLCSSAISIAIGRYLTKNRPKNVEVWVCSMGSEEVGDKGAKAFVEKYGKLGSLDNAYAFVMDACGAGTEIFIIHKDTMHHATYSMEVIERIQHAHEMLKKEKPETIECKIGRIPLGSTDACRYIQAGYKAAAIIAIDGKLKKPRNWHSIHDIPENLDKNLMKDILEICLNFVELVDHEYEAL